MKHNRKINMKEVVIFAIVSALFIVLFAISGTYADSAVYEINNFDELVQAAELSRQSGHQNDTYILKSDIEITEENQATLNSSSFKHISFGSSDYPFKGTFDGQGHSISNLRYESTLDPKSDTGLFSNTGTGAVIKNLTILNAEIQSDYRGGIISGYSEGTTFENITVKDSHLFVGAINNVLTLITDGGIRGGAIVGEANNCVLYNCESINTRVNTNNTSGVAALSGKGLYLGGLIGNSVSTDVEYSRVEGGLIKNYYDVAVEALGGNTLYVGGIIGQMNGDSKVIDSYSTAELNFYCATYVSVGAGNTGHIGGIAGAMFGSQNEIIRSHYAGIASSRQYNAVLVIPIIQDNVNISGIANVYEGGKVENAYYKPSLNPNVSMTALGSSSSSGSYGPVSDSQYIDKEFWQAESYDLSGNIERNTSYNQSHINKWVIDYKKGIPIHGQSISATLDYKGAGEVTIDSTQLVDTSVSTENPYTFAVQGVHNRETTASIRAVENEGYRFVSWYRIPDILTDKINEDYEYFNKAFSKYEPISNEKVLENISIEDNDLFIAYYQAHVLYHDIDGNLIDVETGNAISESTQKDWYDYNEKINCAEPINRPSSENAKLIGWTTTESNEPGGGYSSITAPELTALKNDNAFYETGDSIIKTMNLYPVYVDSISNINTVFEGNEQDDINDESQREGVGYTSVNMNENKNVVITVTGENEDGTFPEGYRFLGWYDENGHKVSKETSYELIDVDLTQVHTYTAKFEYLVEYYVRAFAQHDGGAFTESELFSSIYQGYNIDFQNIPSPGYIKEYISHWGTEHVNHGRSDDKSDAYSGKITEPLKVYSHNNTDAVGGGTLYQAYVTMDFPGAGRINDEHAGTGGKFRLIPVSDRYKLNFWTLERSNNAWTYINNPMNTGTLDPSVQYKGMAMVTADIIFHKKQGEDLTVLRRYEDKLFMNEDTSHTYKYPFMHQNDDVNTDPEDGDYLNKTITLQASPSRDEMKISGYVFLGWISSTEVEKDSEEWNYIYDVTDDLYCTSDITKVKPYLLSEDTIVSEVMDAYPVYAKYNVETSTNVNFKISEEINTPQKPGYTITENQDEIGVATVTITPDLDTFVIGNSGEKYVLSSLVRVDESGKEEIIRPDENNSYKYTIEAGKEYKFIAKYETIILVYHLNDSDVKNEIKTNGEAVGEMPTPTYEIKDLSENYIFVGWSSTKPTNNGYHKLASYSEIEGINIISNTTTITNSMELWPVYVKMQIEVNSNIDDYLIDNNLETEDVRYITRPGIDKSQLNAEEVEGYQFIGWYKNYDNSQEEGELVTGNKTYLLQRKESLEPQTYTAVYTRAYKVNYYNTKGEVIYTADVKQGEDRTFVNEVTGEDGEKITVPIDYEAYQKINDSLNLNESFRNWQWEKSDGTVVQWEDFYDKNITQDMNLYPIVRNITVQDSDGNEIDIIGTSEKEPDIVLGTDSEKIYAYFNIDYEKPSLTVHIEDVSYGDNQKTSIKYPKDIEVILYKNSDITGESLANKKTDENGNAKIEFTGEITINITNEEESKEDIFIFQVLDKEGNVVSEVLVSKGESKTIKLPYGVYKVVEKNEWSWRYNNDFYEDIKVNNNNDKVNVTYEETRGINKWFDSMTHADNEY